MSALQKAADPAASPGLVRTSLYDLHISLGARMVGFAGYALPVQYSPGIIQEHLFTRASAGLFDVSHMGQALLEGADAACAFEALVPGDIAALVPGEMRYTLLLNKDGRILDDLIVTRLSDANGRGRLRLVVNAATKQADFAHIAELLPGCALTVLVDRALLALQGPKAAAALCRHLSPEAARRIASLPFMSAQAIEHEGITLDISRSGYTGEDGFEISLPAQAAREFAERLLADEEVRPAGLGARDSLRLEAGFCLYGHDIDETTSPVEAGLSWTISKRRRKEGGFLGFEAIKREIETGPRRLRAGFLIEGKIPAREGAMVLDTAGQMIGRITSGGFAPSLGKPIAMGYTDAACAAPGTRVLLAQRGKELASTVAAMPFVPHRYFRKAR